MVSYNYLVVGALGQVGSAIMRYLVAQNESVAVVARHPNARGLIRRMVGDRVGLVQGDATVIELPRVNHIINAAGHTNLAGAASQYVKANTLLPMRLGIFAKSTGATLHHISSIAVMSLHSYAYRLSKLRAETFLIRNMNLEQLHIYRIGDVIPSPGRIETDFRRSHWLPMLFQCNGFRHFGPKYEVYLSSGEEIAEAIVALQDLPGVHWTCGLRYSFDDLSMFATSPYNERHAKTVHRIMRADPPLSSLFDPKETEDHLTSRNFWWTRFHSEYWAMFNKIATTSVEKE